MPQELISYVGSSVSMHTLTGHYPNDRADHSLRYAGVNTLILVFRLREYQLLCSRYNPVPEKSETEISLSTTEIVPFLPPLLCDVMFYGHASITRKKTMEQHFLLSHNQSTSKQNCRCRVWPTALIKSLVMPGWHKMPWREEDTVHGTIPGLESTTEAPSLLDRLPSNPPRWFLEPNLALKKTSISAQPKQIFSQWSDSFQSYCLCYCFLLAVTVSSTYWSWTPS